MRMPLQVEYNKRELKIVENKYVISEMIFMITEFICCQYLLFRLHSKRSRCSAVDVETRVGKQHHGCYKDIRLQFSGTATSLLQKLNYQLCF